MYNIRIWTSLARVNAQFHYSRWSRSASDRKMPLCGTGGTQLLLKSCLSGFRTRMISRESHLATTKRRRQIDGLRLLCTLLASESPASFSTIPTGHGTRWNCKCHQAPWTAWQASMNFRERALALMAQWRRRRVAWQSYKTTTHNWVGWCMSRCKASLKSGPPFAVREYL